ncbi:MAG: hypothetical protein Q7S44_00560 [bacterium]|nr:hypothetical protein [bacterium]
MVGDIRKNYGDVVEAGFTDSQLLSDGEFSKLPHTLLKGRPSLLGFSVQIGALPHFERMMDELLKTGSPPSIVAGGFLPTFIGDYLAEKYRGLIVVRGRGEESLRGIVNLLLNGSGNLEDIPNLAFQDRNGEVVQTKRKFPELEVVGLPAMDFIKEYKQDGIQIGLETSVGCSYGHCSFCDRQAFYDTVTFKPFPIERTIDILRNFTEFGVSGVNIVDDNFTDCLGLEHQQQLLHSIIAAKECGSIDRRIQLFPSTRIDGIVSNDRVRDAELVNLWNLLKRANTRAVFVGIESCSLTQRKRYRKGLSQRQIQRAIGRLRELDIKPEIGFIMFDPEVTPDELMENVCEIERLGIGGELSYPFSRLVLRPEIPLLSRMGKLGMLTGNFNPNMLSYEYRWQNEQSERIYFACRNWGKRSFGLFTAIKDSFRVENFTGDMHSKLAAALDLSMREFRQLYLGYLKDCTRFFMCSNSTSKVPVELDASYDDKVKSLIMNVVFKGISNESLFDFTGKVVMEGIIVLLRLNNGSLPLRKAQSYLEHFFGKEKVMIVLNSLVNNGDVSLVDNNLLVVQPLE